MAYELIITKRADELLDNLLYHIIFRLKNEQAASHLLNSIEKIYDRMIMNPFQFAVCRDNYLQMRGYREAVLPDMDYVLIYSVDREKAIIYVLGIFHVLESYGDKL